MDNALCVVFVCGWASVVLCEDMLKVMRFVGQGFARHVAQVIVEYCIVCCSVVVCCVPCCGAVSALDPPSSLHWNHRCVES